jgi:D-alanyl-D-alanine carboxypeptidase
MKNAPKVLTTMFVVFFVLQLLFYARLHANNADPSKLDTYIDNMQLKNEAMFSIAIAQHGHPFYTRSIGYTDTALTVYSGAQTQYRVGELSRLFTAVILLQLADEKMIQMGTPVSRFFPEIPNGKNISIEMLLTGKVHILDYLPGGKNYLPVKSEYAFQQQLELDAASPVHPDAAPAFSNANYILLGLIIEKITHQTYGEVLRQRITEPAGLKNTFIPATDLPARYEACSFNLFNNQWNVQGKWDLTSIQAAGGILSTPNDLGKFMYALYHEKLIPQKYLLRLGINDMGKGVGLSGIYMGHQTGIQATGRIDGFESRIYYFPADDICISISSNARPATHANFMDELVQVLYGDV